MFPSVVPVRSLALPTDPVILQDIASKVGYLTTPKIWGAVGDGIADDYSAIQAAINAASAAGGGTVWFPQGIFKLGSGLTLKNKVSLRGVGMFASTILVANDQRGLVYDSVAQGLSDTDAGISISDLTIKGASNTAGTGAKTLLYFFTGSYLDVERVCFDTTRDYCIEINRAKQWSIRNSRLTNCRTGCAKIGGTTPNDDWANSGNIINNEFEDGLTTAGSLRMEACGAVTVENNSFEGLNGGTNATYAVAIDACSNINFSNNFIELYADSNIRFENRASVTVALARNHMQSNGATAKIVDASPGSLAHDGIDLDGNGFASNLAGQALFDPGAAVSYSFKRLRRTSAVGTIVAGYGATTVDVEVFASGAVLKCENNGDLVFDCQTGKKQLFRVNGAEISRSDEAGFSIGSNGTPMQLVAFYTPTLSPSAVSANTTAEQTFIVAGLTTADKIIAVTKPMAQAGLGIVGWRVDGANTLAITFANNTGGSITPTPGEIYTVMAVRI